MRVLINGEFRDRIDCRDRGFQYGDGVFETMAIANGSICHFNAHFARLQNACRTLQLPPPDKAQIVTESELLLQQSTVGVADKAVLKLILSRGSGERGYAPPARAQCTRCFHLTPWPAHVEQQREQGIAVKVCEMRLGINPRLAGIKHLNRLEQVLAASELAESDFSEGIMLDALGQVVEATRSNVFLVSQGRLKTPLLDQCGVAGVTRERVLEAAQSEGINVRAGRVSLDALLAADEIFLTNSIAGVLPVSQVGESKFAIGPVTRRLQKLLQLGERT